MLIAWFVVGSGGDERETGQRAANLPRQSTEEEGEANGTSQEVRGRKDGTLQQVGGTFFLNTGRVSISSRFYLGSKG